jgi:hypothetical protein
LDREKQKPFPGIRDAFSLDYWFLVSSVLPDVGNPWEAFTGHPAERPSSTEFEPNRELTTETTIIAFCLPDMTYLYYQVERSLKL